MSLARRVLALQRLCVRAPVKLAFARPQLRTFAAEAASSAHIVQSFLDRKEVLDRVMTVIKNFEKVDQSKVTPTAHFVNDLSLDSLDAVEVAMALEEEFMITIPDAEAEKILSVEDAVNFIAAHPQAK